MIFESIKKLVTYGLESGLIEESDRVYTTNRLLEALDLEEYDEPAEEFSDVDLESTLKELLDYAVEKGLTEKFYCIQRSFRHKNSWGFLLQDRQR